LLFLDIERGFRDFKNHRTVFDLQYSSSPDPHDMSVSSSSSPNAYFSLLLSGAHGRRRELHRKLSSQSATKELVLRLRQVGYYVPLPKA